MKFFLVLILALLAGCSGITGPDTASIVLLVDVEVAGSADHVTVRLVNASEREIGYNLCGALLERQDGTRWHAAEQGRTCFGIMYVLRPGGESAESRPLPPGTAPGVYRFRLEVHADTLRPERVETLWSSEFEVR
jgi:hypothetical protein